MTGLDPNTIRGKMLIVAANLIAKKGYERGTLHDIAEEMGVQHPAVYHYFPSKKSMFNALIDMLMTNLASYRPHPAEMELLIRDGTVEEVVNMMVYTFPEEDHQLMIQLLRIFLMHTFTMPELTKLYHEKFIEGHRAYVEHILKRLTVFEKIPEMDTHAMAIAINEAVNYRALRSCMFMSLDSYLDYRKKVGDKDMQAFRSTVLRWLTEGEYCQIGMIQLEPRRTKKRGA